MNFWNLLTSEVKLNPVFLRQFFSRRRFAREDARVKNLSLVPLPKIFGVAPSGGEGPVLFAVADAGYFTRFANMFATSAAMNSPKSAVHIHVLGVNEKPTINLDKLPLHFSISFEPADFSKMNIAEKGRYCQSMRFVRLADFVRQTGREYVAFDIDGLFQKSFANFKLQSDVGLIMRPEFSDPGLYVNAGVVYMCANPAAQKFMDCAATHMLRHLQHAPYIEKLDQRCLTLAMNESVMALPQEIYTFVPGRGYFYSAKGKAKNDVLRSEFEAMKVGAEIGEVSA
jgi:hypothetical protein